MPRMPIEQLVNAVLKLIEIAQPLIQTMREGGQGFHAGASGEEGTGKAGDGKAARTMLDMAEDTARTFFSDLFTAVKKDADLMRRMAEEGTS